LFCGATRDASDEAFTPSLGILGIGGAIAFVIGATIFIEVDAPGLAISMSVVADLVATTLGFMLIVMRLVVKSYRRPVRTGREELVGARGEVLQWRGETGAALVAAAAKPQRVRALVSRGGRPDLAGPSLGRVRAPTLLIVGGADTTVLELNREAYGAMNCEKKLEVIAGATHLFEEPGALDKVVEAARDWFLLHLKAGSS
jgi:pimeloyl-ACP methyl ester carboxylesterase